MTIKAYTLPSNTSSRKAVKFLEDNGIKFVEQRMTDTPLTKEQLIEMLAMTDGGVEDVLSTRSKEYKLLTEEGVDFEDIRLSELAYIIERYPRIMRAPIVVGKGKVMAGYVADEIGTFIDKSVRKAQINSILKRELEGYLA